MTMNIRGTSPGGLAISAMLSRNVGRMKTVSMIRGVTITVMTTPDSQLLPCRFVQKSIGNESALTKQGIKNR